MIVRHGAGCLLVASMLCASGAQCGWLDVRDAVFSPVFIIDTEMLTPPVVPRSAVFKPQQWFAIEPGDASARRAAGFCITVAAQDAPALQMRLVDIRSGDAAPLARIEPWWSPDTADTAVILTLLAAQARDTLLEETPVFSFTAPHAASGELEHRLAVLIPEILLTGFDALEVFTAQADDGSAIGADRIELARDFFYMAVVGDSIMWGNGLRDRDKFPAIVADHIQARTGQRVICQMHAISGARIVPEPGEEVCLFNCSGEVPKAMTSILTQVDLIEQPESMDLILADGGINDVGVTTILNPKSDEDELMASAQRYCGDELLGLLGKLRAAAPQARIVVTGYYPIITTESDLAKAFDWLDLLDVTGRQEQATLQVIAGQMTRFVEAAHAAAVAAVEAVNAAAGQRVVAFADPGYGPANAIFAPDPWVYGLGTRAGIRSSLFGEIELFPQDPLFEQRLVACQDKGVAAGVIQCVFGSVGHPNPRGARAYADAVIAALPELGLVPQ